MDLSSLAVKQPSSAESLWHREQKRRANDVIRVYNPTNTDFIIKWEGNNFKVPAKGTWEGPHYLASAYKRDMVVQLINELSAKKRIEWEEKRKKEGAAPINDYERNLLLFPTEPRTDNEELVRAFSKQIWLGTVRRFGLDDITPTQSGSVDLRTLEEKIQEELDLLVVDPLPLEADLAPVLPVKDKKTLEAEVTSGD